MGILSIGCNQKPRFWIHFKGRGQQDFDEKVIVEIVLFPQSKTHTFPRYNDIQAIHSKHREREGATTILMLVYVLHVVLGAFCA